MCVRVCVGVCVCSRGLLSHVCISQMDKVENLESNVFLLPKWPSSFEWKSVSVGCLISTVSDSVLRYIQSNLIHP